MAYQAGWEPQWQYIVRGRGIKPRKALFAMTGENEPVAQPIHGSGFTLQVITIDEFNTQFAWSPTAIRVVELALARAKAQGIRLPKVITAADLLAEFTA